jgi:hypothetical protein
MESKKSNLFASDTRRTYVRHKGGEIGPNWLYCKEKRVSDTPLASYKPSLQLQTTLVFSVQHEAVRQGMPPSELRRTAITSFLARDDLAARHTELLSEVAQTCSLLVRFLDKPIGAQTTDTLVHTAEDDAQSDVTTGQQRGGAA